MVCKHLNRYLKAQDLETKAFPEASHFRELSFRFPCTPFFPIAWQGEALNAEISLSEDKVARCQISGRATGPGSLPELQQMKL